MSRLLSPARVAEAFSTADYDRAVPYLAEGAVWEIFDGETRRGRAAIEAGCRGAAVGFTSVRAKLCIDEMDEDGQVILVTGTEDFFLEGKPLQSVAVCDVYTFCPAGRILSISSYCADD